MAVVPLDPSHMWALIVQASSVGKRAVLVEEDVTAHNAGAL